MNVVVLGGCGFVGSYLIPHLLADGHKVTVYDIMYFGDGHLPKDNSNLDFIKGDIRDSKALRLVFRNADAVVNLACISNDHSCQLDEALSTSVNYDAFEPMVVAAKEAGVKRFIYCSSSSVYGIADTPEVTEEHPLKPLTLYNRYKGMCEPLLFKHQSPDFTCVTIRPATVCGYAPRMRFDLTVNAMTHDAIRKGVITVYGGQQERPNLHIKDMVRCYQTLLTAPADLIAGQTFNVGHRNMKVAAIAEVIADVVEKEGFKRPTIETKQNTDDRSYRINSGKIAEVLGFIPQFTVEDAIRDIANKFRDGLWKDTMDADSKVTGPYSNVVQLVQKYGLGVKA